MGATQNGIPISPDTFIAAIRDARETLARVDVADDGEPQDFPIPSPPTTPPLVSVEVLVYNQARTLRQCVESIVAQQTSFSFEVIIGNDCSTDDSLDVALALQRTYPDKIRVVSTRRNVGLNRNARNVRRVMRGVFAAFCEGDDGWLTQTRLQEQVRILQGKPNVSLVHGLTQFYDEKSGTTTESALRWKLPPNRFAQIFDETYRVETAGAVCRVRDLLRIYHECPQLIDAHFRMLDTQLFCLLSFWGEVECLPYAVSVRRYSGQSLSRNDNPLRGLAYHDNAFAMMRMLCDYFHQGRRARERIVNHYLSSAHHALLRTFTSSEARVILQALYPEFRHRIACLSLIPQPRNRVLRKVYYHLFFPVAKYRNSFCIKPVRNLSPSVD